MPPTREELLSALMRATDQRDVLLAGLKALLGECEHAGVVSIPFSFDIAVIADARAAIKNAEAE